MTAGRRREEPGFAPSASGEAVGRGLDAGRSAVEDMDVHHGRGHVLVDQKLLDARMSLPSSRRCVAKEWRNVWHVARLGMPEARTALLAWSRGLDAHVSRCPPLLDLVRCQHRLRVRVVDPVCPRRQFPTVRAHPSNPRRGATRPGFSRGSILSTGSRASASGTPRPESRFGRPQPCAGRRMLPSTCDGSSSILSRITSSSTSSCTRMPGLAVKVHRECAMRFLAPRSQVPSLK
jgi:hypothetical protein